MPSMDAAACTLVFLSTMTMARCLCKWEKAKRTLCYDIFLVVNCLVLKSGDLVLGFITAHLIIKNKSKLMLKKPLAVIITVAVIMYNISPILLQLIIFLVYVTSKKLRPHVPAISHSPLLLHVASPAKHIINLFCITHASRITLPINTQSTASNDNPEKIEDKLTTHMRTPRSPSKRSISGFTSNVNQITILTQLQLGIIALNKHFIPLYLNFKGQEIVDKSYGVEKFCNELKNCVTSQLLIDDLKKYISLPYPRKWETRKYYSMDEIHHEKYKIHSIQAYYIDSQDLLTLLIKEKEDSIESQHISKNLKEITSCSLFHELLNLINGIIGNTELLEGGIAPEKRQFFINSLLFSKILSMRLRDIDDFTKISFNKFRLHHQYFSIEEMLYEIDSIMKQFSSIKQIEFSLIHHKDVPSTMLADKERLLQVIINTLYTIIENVSSGIMTLEVKKLPHEFFEFLITIRSHQKRKIEAIFESIKEYKSHQEFSSIVNIEGISLISSSLIANSLGRGLEFIKKNDQYFISITCKDGFNIAYENSSSQQLAIKQFSECAFYKKQRMISTNTGIIHDHIKIFPKKRKQTINEEQQLICTNSNESMDIPEEIEKYCQNTVRTTQCKFLTAVSNQNVALMKIRKWNSFLPYNSFETLKRIEEDDITYSAMVVDDNDINIFVLSNLLKTFGISSFPAKDGQECVKEVAKLISKKELHHLKIVFMDMQMPVMDGIEATSSILKLIEEYGTCRVPVIGISCNNNEEDRRRFILSGVDEFASKPVSKCWLKGILLKYNIING